MWRKVPNGRQWPGDVGIVGGLIKRGVRTMNFRVFLCEQKFLFPHNLHHKTIVIFD